MGLLNTTHHHEMAWNYRVDIWHLKRNTNMYKSQKSVICIYPKSKMATHYYANEIIFDFELSFFCIVFTKVPVT